MKRLTALAVAAALLAAVPGQTFYAAAAEMTGARTAAPVAPLPAVQVPLLLEELSLPAPQAQDLAALQGSFDSLPADATRPPAEGERMRAAARLEVTQDASGALSVRMAPGAAIGLGASTARYPGIGWDVVRNPAFQARVAALFARLPEEVRRLGVEIGVHQMRVVDGEVVPEGFHQDEHGHFVAVWAVGRRNAAGGRSLVARDAAGRDVVYDKALSDSDFVAFDNRSLFHTVTPISRVDPSRPAVRDVFAFAVAPLPASRLTDGQRALFAAQAREELSKPEPNASRLRTIYEAADSRLKSLMLLAFRHWSRYFKADAAQWSFLKAATAPWASRVYTVELRSFLEDLRERMGRQLDASKAADAAHKAAIQFSDAFVEAAEDEHPQGLDRDEAALTVGDEALFATFVRPIMDRRQVGAFDREQGAAELARRIKDTVYLYSPDMTVEKIRKILDSSRMRKQLEQFLATVEPFAQAPSQSQAEPNSSKGIGAAVKKGTQAAFGVLLAVASLKLLSLFGAAPHAAWTSAALLIGATCALPTPGLGADAGSPPGRLGALIDKTEEARQGRLSAIYLRDREIDTAIEVLNKRAQNNLFLIGEPGVGKTGIIDGLAQRMADGQTRTPLDGQRLLLLDIGEFIASAAGSPDTFARRTAEIVREASDGRTVLAIDEGHQLARDPNMPMMMMSFFDQVKRPMTEGRFKLVVSTTREEHRRYFAADAALESRSTVLNIEPVEPKAAAGVLFRLRQRYERGQIQIPFAAAKAAVDYTLRAYRFKALMRMAFDALDSAATRLIYGPAETERRLLSLRRDLLHDLEALKQARAQGDRPHEENLVETLRPRLEDYLRLRRQYDQPARTILEPADVEEALRARGAPLRSINEGSVQELERIESLLRRRYVGHPEVVDRVMEALRRRFADPNARRPKFSTLLLGPTGVGKTELARLLGEALFGETDIEKSLIKYNGGELQNKGDITKITGAPPSFVGFGETETLMDKVREKPESVILFDEIEKAHPDILNLLLSILENGSATDSRGRLVDFSHTVIVLTSNYGVPDGYETMEPAAIKAAIDEALRKPVYDPFTNSATPRFRPEFLNRPDLVETMGTLSPEHVQEIAGLRLSELRQRWHDDHGIELSYPDQGGLVQSLMKDGYSPRNGARELKRAIERGVEAPLNRRLADLKQPLRRGDAVAIGADLALEVSRDKEEASPVLRLDSEPGQALAERLERFLAGPALDMDGLDAALDGERDAPQAQEPEATSSFQLREHTPKKADPALSPALAALRAAAGDADADWLGKVAKGLVQKAKRLDLEEAKRRAEGAQWRERFEGAEKSMAAAGGKRLDAAKEELPRAVERANREGVVAFSWTAGAESLRLEVRANARLTLEEDIALRRLFANAAKGVEGTDNADDELAVRLSEAFKRGAKAGYAGGADSTSLWLEWPLPQAQRKAAAAEPVIEKAAEPEPAPKPVAEVESEASAQPMAEEPPAPQAPVYAGPVEIREDRLEIEEKAPASALKLADAKNDVNVRVALRDLDLALYRAGHGRPARAAALAFSRAFVAWSKEESFHADAHLKWSATPDGRILFHNPYSNDGFPQARVQERLAGEADLLPQAAEAGAVLHVHNYRQTEHHHATTTVGLSLPKAAPPSEPKPGEPRYYVAVAGQLADPKTAPQAAFDQYDTLSKMISEKPQLAGPELAETLMQAMELTLGKLGNLSGLVSVDGQSLPERRARNIFELYEQLIEARPDLMTPDLPLVLGRSMLDPSSFSAEQAQAALWISKRCSSIAETAARARPVADTAELTAAMTRMAAGHHESQPRVRAGSLVGKAFLHDLWIYPVLTVAALIAKAAAHLPWSFVWRAPLAVDIAAALIVGAVAWRRFAGWRSRWSGVRLPLEAASAKALRALDAEKRLRIAGTFDYESERWGPKPGAEHLYSDLTRDEDFRDAAARSELRPRPDLDLGRLSMEMAAATDVQDVLRLSKTISLTLAADAKTANAGLEETLRAVISGYMATLGKRKDAQYEGSQTYLAAKDQEVVGGTRMAPRLVREAFDLYEKLALARPDLVPAGFPEPKLIGANLYSTDADVNGSKVAAWTFKRFTALADAIAKKQPSSIPLRHAEALATQGVEADGNFNIARWYDTTISLIWNAVVPLAIWLIACLAVGPENSGPHWATPHGAYPVPYVFLAMKLIALPWLGITILTQLGRLKAYLRWARPARRQAQDILYRQARASDPKAVLEAIASFDYEHERWRPEARHLALFERLKREWPAFSEASSKR